MKLLWSSRNQKFIGHAMSYDELASLSDVYATLSPDYRKRQTSYILQTLWRDFTSDLMLLVLISQVMVLSHMNSYAAS
jgi:hypothetical protein